MAKNDLETVQDLLDIRQQVMMLSSANNALEFSIEQKDDMIQKLKDDLEKAKVMLKQQGQDFELDEKVMKLQVANSKLTQQLEDLIGRNQDLEAKCKQLGVKGATGGSTRDLGGGNSGQAVEWAQRFEALRADKEALQLKYEEVNERNKQLRHKAGQVFLQSL